MKKKIIIALIIVGVISLFFIPERVKVAPYEVTSGYLNDFTEEIGRVELIESQKIISKNGGIIENLCVEVGDEVEKGQSLGYMQNKSEAENLSKAKYNAYLSQQKTTSNILKNNPEYLNMEYSLVLAQNSYEQAKRELEQNKALFEIGATSKEMILRSEEKMKEQESWYKKNLAEVNSNIKNRIIKDAISNLALRKADYLAAREAYDNSVFLAERSGKVLSVDYREGDYISPFSKVIELGDSHKVEIKADVLAENIKNIKVGQKAVIYGDLLGDDEEVLAEVTRVGMQAEKTISLLGAEEYRVPVYLDLERPDSRLIPGGEVQVKIIFVEKEGVIYAPKKAIFDIDDEKFSFVIEDDALKLRKIELGFDNGEFAEILSGLSEGELIVESPSNELEEGIKIKMD